jgi:hypothetical protein
MDGELRMAEGISTRLSPSAQGRRFGTTVGAAFLVLAGVAAWRGKPTTATVLAGLGALLLVGALVAPAALLPVERAWMGLAHAISRVTTPIFMGVVWFLVLTPTAYIRRALGKNLIARDSKAPSYWVPREVGRRRGDLERQF